MSQKQNGSLFNKLLMHNPLVTAPPPPPESQWVDSIAQQPIDMVRNMTDMCQI